MDAAILSELARNQLLRLPPVADRRARRLLSRGYAPEKNSVDYARGTFDRFAERVSARRPISGTVLEIGPGGNLGTTLLFMQAGCERAVCVDVFPLLSDQLPLYRQLVDHPEQLLERLEYRSPEPIESADVADGSCDIVFSSACLEHVSDPAAATTRIAALLKPGGVTTHGIDLRDHRDFGQPLRFLRHGHRLWRAATSRRIYTNRWRPSDGRRAFEAAGLVDIEIEPVERVPVTEEMRRGFAPPFRDRSLDDLAMAQIMVTASKPGPRAA